MDTADVALTTILIMVLSFIAFMHSKTGNRILFGEPKKDMQSDESYFTEEERAYLKELVKEKRTKTNL